MNLTQFHYDGKSSGNGWMALRITFLPLPCWQAHPLPGPAGAIFSSPGACLGKAGEGTKAEQEKSLHSTTLSWPSPVSEDRRTLNIVNAFWLINHFRQNHRQCSNVNNLGEFFLWLRSKCSKLLKRIKVMTYYNVIITNCLLYWRWQENNSPPCTQSPRVTWNSLNLCLFFFSISIHSFPIGELLLFVMAFKEVIFFFLRMKSYIFEHEYDIVFLG